MRRNFQQIQEGRTLTPHGKDKHGKEREEIPEPGPPARPPIIPHRLIGIILTDFDCSVISYNAMIH